MSNYKQLYMPNHPNSNVNGVISEHRYIASKMLGRPLKKQEEVHHLDENPLNNKEENLIVFATKTDHKRFHWRFKCDFDVLEKNEDGVYRIKQSFNYVKETEMICENCKKTFISDKSYHKREHIFCSKECHNKSMTKADISEEYLYDLLVNKKMSFVSVGKLLGISDNAVRKKCKKNLELFSDVLNKKPRIKKTLTQQELF